jgi:hypothetical protein
MHELYGVVDPFTPFKMVRTDKRQWLVTNMSDKVLSVESGLEDSTAVSIIGPMTDHN